MTETYADLVEPLTALGYDRLIPLRKGGKAPRYRGWEEANTAPPTPVQRERWAKRGQFDGVGCAAGGEVFGLDLDQADERHAAIVQRAADEILGPTPVVRVGRSPKSLRMYRQATPIATRTLRDVDVGLYGTTGQFVMFGTHPDTRKPYFYPDASPLEMAVAELPPIDQAGVDRFVRELRATLPDQGPGDAGAGRMGVAYEAQAYWEATHAADPSIDLATAMARMMSEATQRHPTMTGIVAFLSQCGWGEDAIISAIAEAYLGHFSEKRELVSRWRKLEYSIRGAQAKGIAADPAHLVAATGFDRWGRGAL